MSDIDTIDRIMHFNYAIIPYIRMAYSLVLVVLLAWGFFYTGRRLCIALFCVSGAFSLWQDTVIVVMTIFKHQMSRGFKQCLFVSNTALEYLDFCVYLAAWILLIKYLISIQNRGTEKGS